MPFIKENFYLKDKIKAIRFLQDRLGVSLKEAQKIIDKGRISLNNKVFLDKSGYLLGEVNLSYFKPLDLNLKPIFQTSDFAIFDKPADLLTHPKGRFHHISLLDSARYMLGKEANPINRLDKETSGILLVSKNKQSEIKLKELFAAREVKKSYLAYVEGRLKSCTIDLAIRLQDRSKDLGIRSIISKHGKEAITKIELISYDSIKNISLIRAIPLTGRTHQIRLHLSHIGHRILGDSLYGVNDALARAYLDKEIKESERVKLFGASRLMLHAKSLEFCFLNVRYNIHSKMPFEVL